MVTFSQVDDGVFLGVLDGHSGVELAQFAADTLPSLLAQQSELRVSPGSALERTFAQLDDAAYVSHGEFSGQSSPS